MLRASTGNSGGQLPTAGRVSLLSFLASTHQTELSAITKSDSVLLLVRFRTSAVITQLVEYPTRNLECFGSIRLTLSGYAIAGADEGERHFGIR